MRDRLLCRLACAALLGATPVAEPARALEPDLALDQCVLRAWNDRDGLPQNSVMSIAQTGDGYLWLGTLEGLARFDGARFQVFDRRTNPEMTSQRVQVVTRDPAGYLWVGTENGGLLRFDGARFEPLPPANRRDSGWTVTALAIARDGSLWIGTLGELLRLPEGARAPVVAVSDADGVWSIAEAEDGTLWVATNRGVMIRRGAGFAKVELPPEAGSAPIRALAFGGAGELWLGPWEGGGALRLRRDGDAPWASADIERFAPEATVVHLLRDRDGGLWLGTEGHGLLRHSARGLERLDAERGYPADFVLSLFEDREGNLWSGSDTGGLSQLRAGKFLVLDRRRGLGRDFVLSVLEDRRGDLWVGAYDGGVDRVRRQRDGGFEVEHFGIADGLPDSWAWSLLEDRAGDLWVGTYDGLARRRDGRFEQPFARDLFRGVWVRALLESRDGILWIGTHHGLFRARGGATPELSGEVGGELAGESILALAEASDGSIWIGSRRGVHRWRSGRLEPLAGTGRARVRCFHEDAEGHLWIGTEGSGLFVLDGGTLRRLSGAQGLHDDLASRILEDDEGYLWISSNKGIFRARRTELLAAARGGAPVEGEVFDAEDGMPSRECNGASQPAGWRDHKGRLWFPTIQGLVGIDPARIRRNPFPPPIEIESLTVDGKTQPTTPDYRIAPGSRALRIDYTATSLVAPESVRFRYRLLGFEESWVDAGTRRSAFFTNLPPGRYRFQLSAANDDGIWNEAGAELLLEQLPRWYETRAARSSIALALVALVAGIFWLRTRSLGLRARELELLVARRTEELAAAVTRTAEQAEKLRELDGAKNRFFANVSHEFRTPLTLILGPLERVLAGADGMVGAGVQRQLGQMRTAARKLRKLIDELLDLSKLSAAKLSLSVRPVAIVPWLDRVVDAFDSLAAARGIALSFREPGEPLELWIDPERLEAVLANLLSNAIRHTPAGGRVAVAVAPAGAGWMAITVADSGEGIPAEALSKLFDRFYQLPGGRGGTGVGLALARELVELHRGEIAVESELGGGARFTVRLRTGRAHFDSDVLAAVPAPEVEEPSTPAASLAAIELEEAQPASMLPPAATATAATSNQPLVLVVDDHAGLRAYVRDCLEASCRVAEASDGARALELARTLGPDLIVSDVMMPHSDGFELCAAIKGSAELDHLPVILLTARADPVDRLAGLKLGADDYLAKPFEPAELAVRVANLIRIRKRLHERYRRNGLVSLPDVCATSQQERFLERLVAAVENRLADPELDVPQLAASVAMSPRHLQRKLKAIVGDTPHGFLRRLRLERARQLLERQAGNVSEIAAAVGFQDTGTFSKLFRAQFGLPPSTLLRRTTAGSGS